MARQPRDVVQAAQRRRDLVLASGASAAAGYPGGATASASAGMSNGVTASGLRKQTVPLKIRCFSYIVVFIYTSMVAPVSFHCDDPLQPPRRPEKSTRLPCRRGGLSTPLNRPGSIPMSLRRQTDLSNLLTPPHQILDRPVETQAID